MAFALKSLTVLVEPGSLARDASSCSSGHPVARFSLPFAEGAPAGEHRAHLRAAARPRVGPQSARRIAGVRGKERLRSVEALGALGVSWRIAAPFVLLDGKPAIRGFDRCRCSDTSSSPSNRQDGPARAAVRGGCDYGTSRARPFGHRTTQFFARRRPPGYPSHERGGDGAQMPRVPKSASVQELVAAAIAPVVDRIIAAVAHQVELAVAQRLRATPAARRGPATVRSRVTGKARARTEITRWVADRRARRVPTFVIEATGLDTKKKIVAKYGENAKFEKEKPIATGSAEAKPRDVKARGPIVRKKAAAA